MKFRRVPSMDWEVSVLGAGARMAPALLPSAGSSAVGQGPSDFVEGFRSAVEAGVNYLDLGWFSGMERHGPWSDTVGLALADGYREKVRVAANVPPALAASRDQWARFLGDLSSVLGVGRLDFCVVGGIDRLAWEGLVAADFSGSAASILEEGFVEALGFFICDDLQVMKRVMAEFDGWSLCKLRYGFWDHLKNRPGSTGVAFAAAQELLVVAAEPTRGALGWHGEGASAALPEVAGLDGPLDEWALRWAWDDPGVSTVVCDLESSSQWERYLELAEQAEPRSLSIAELTALNWARDHYVKSRPIPCPACRTCMPCPEDIDIPRILDLYNDAVVYGGVDNARDTYAMEQHRASSCTACGMCEDSCPWDIPIIQHLEQAQDLFE